MSDREPRAVSESLQTMRDLVEALQGPVGELRDLALDVHARLRPGAPQLLQANRDAPRSFWYISSANYHEGIPVSDTLTLKVEDGRWIEIDKYSGPNLNTPVWRFDYWFPHDEWRRQRTTVKVFHEDSIASFPLDISEALYRIDNGRCDSLVGEPYEDQEEHIQGFMDQLRLFQQ